MGSSAAIFPSVKTRIRPESLKLFGGQRFRCREPGEATAPLRSLRRLSEASVAYRSLQCATDAYDGAPILRWRTDPYDGSPKLRWRTDAYNAPPMLTMAHRSFGGAPILTTALRSFGGVPMLTMRHRFLRRRTDPSVAHRSLRRLSEASVAYRCLQCATDAYDGVPILRWRTDPYDGSPKLRQRYDHGSRFGAFSKLVTNGRGGAVLMQERSSPCGLPRSMKSAIRRSWQLPAPAWVPAGIRTSRPLGKPLVTIAASSGGVTGSRSPEKSRTGISERTSDPEPGGSGACGQMPQTASWSRTRSSP